MPSKSKSQQRFFGMVDAYKKGEMKNASKKIKKAANDMSISDVKDFAETKHKGLPEKVKENKNMNKKLIRLTEGDLHKIVKESVNKILSEIGDTSRGCKMLGRAYHKANNANDIVRGQKFGNYLRDKYGYTPREFFDGIDDAENEEKTA